MNDLGKVVKFDPPEKERTYWFPQKVLFTEKFEHKGNQYQFDNHHTTSERIEMVSITLKNVTELIVGESGTHRLKTADGKSHIIPTGWLHIELDIKDWTI